MARYWDRVADNRLRLATAIADVPLTVSLWLWSVEAGNMSLFSICGASSSIDVHELLIYGTNQLHVRTRPYVATASVSAATYPQGRWCHVAGVWSSSAMRQGWLDGVASTANTVNVSVSGLDTTLAGARVASGSYIDAHKGRLAEVAVWSAALSGDQVLAIRAGRSPLSVRPDALVGYWPVRGVGPRELDLSGRGNALTVDGTLPMAAQPRLTRSPVSVRPGRRLGPVGSPLIGGRRTIKGASTC